MSSLLLVEKPKLKYLVFDNFNRGDAASLGNAITGQAWTVWQSAVFSIVSGKARCTTNNTGVDVNRNLVDVEAGYPNVTVSAYLTLPITAWNNALHVRKIDNSNYLEFVAYNSGVTRKLQLWKRDVGAFTLLVAATDDLYTPPVTPVFSVRAFGTLIQCFLDNVNVITHTLIGGDATKFSTPTKVGFGSAIVLNQDVDDFLVRPA